MSRIERLLFRKVELWAVIAMALMLALSLGLYTIWARVTNAFPFPIIAEVEDYILANGAIRKTRLREKIINDIGGTPHRYTFPRVETAFLTGADEVSAPEGFFRDDRLPPRARLAEGAGFDDLVMLYGVFEMEGARFGAVLVDPQSHRIARAWPVAAGAFSGEPRKAGFDPETGVFFHSYADTGLTALNYCGEEIWRIDAPGVHHSIEPTGDGAIWHFERLEMVKRDIATGEALRRVDFLDMLFENRELKYLSITMRGLTWRYDNVEAWWTTRIQSVGKPTADGHEFAHDPFHLNDAEPAPDGFFGDDRDYLAISSRRLNAVFVADLETLKFRHVLLGRTSRQHDPDFHADGSITIWDNNNNHGHSKIVSWRPGDDAVELVWDGADHNIANVAHGNVTRLGEDAWMVLDFTGRLIVTKGGAPVYIFENRYSDSHALELRNAWPLPRADYARLEAGC